MDLWPPAPDSRSTLVRISALIQTPKTVVPCTTLKLLGIELNSVTQETRISHTRLDETLELLRAWHSKASCRQRLLLSLIGKLNLICSVCRPGRAFLSRLIEPFFPRSHPSHHICLTKRFFKDIGCWLSFLPDWNGRSMFLATHACMCLPLLVLSHSEGYSAPSGFVQPFTMSVFPLVAP